MPPIKIKKLTKKTVKQKTTVAKSVGQPTLSSKRTNTAYTTTELASAKKRLRLGRWSSLREQSLVNRMMDLQEQEADLRDMEPDLVLMRALIADYVENYQLITDALIQWYHDAGEKPKRIPDLSEAVSMLEKATRVVERMERIEQSGSITLATFRRVIEQFGLIVASHVRDPHVLAAIEEQWSSIQLETKKKHKDEAPIDVEAISAPDHLLEG